jgi:glucokinase
MAALPLAIGVDIGGTKIAAGVVDGAGQVLARSGAQTPSHSPLEVEDAIATVVEELSRAHPVAAVGIGAAGFVDSSGSEVLFAPHLAWRNEPLREAVRHRVRVPVWVDNDANAAAWAESRFGIGRGEDHLLCITLGTGIGGGLVLRGQIYRGRYGLAGEFGHQQVVPDGHRCRCGNPGCWEEYASGNALAREAQALAAEDPAAGQEMLRLAHGDASGISGKVVGEAAAMGDPAAIELLAEAGRWLGIGLANLAAALDPGMFVIGGGVSDAGDLLLDPTRASFRQSLTGRGFRAEARIERALLGAEAGLVGAADLARTLGPTVR